MEVEQENKLDYSLKDPKDRIELVNKIVSNIDKNKLSTGYLHILSNYIISSMNKEFKKTKAIITDNREITINKRETSYQGLSESFESGEDGIYNLIANDKNILFSPRVLITEEDLEDIPILRELKAAIAEVNEQMKRASGKRKFFLKKQVIELSQDQYIIKNIYKPPMYFTNAAKGITKIRLDGKVTVTENGDINDTNLISLFNPKHICALLCNYSRLKEQLWDNFECDCHWLMEDLDNLIEKTLRDKYPVYYDILILKIDGKRSDKIRDKIEEKYGVSYTTEYISSLWRKKIPKLLADKEQKDFLVWYYTTQEYGKWKRCSKCKEVKLAHTKFFSRNRTSKDGFYSICKDCRSKKVKEANK